MSENNSKILLILLIGFFNAIFVFGQSDSVYFIKVHFVYGSKPLKKYKSTEQKIVGGLHGGHVSIQVEENDYSFEPINRIHIFPHKKNHHSSYVSYKGTKGMRYDTTLKTTSFTIVLTDSQFQILKKINKNYCTQSPYDYAFFGMRCASSVQEVLGEVGILDNRKKFRNIITTFYPKKLRKRFFKLAEKNQYKISHTKGRNTRRWEND